MHYIIDGHNLIGKMPDISLKDPNDEIKLTMRIKSWVAESKKRQVTVQDSQPLLWRSSFIQQIR